MQRRCSRYVIDVRSVDKARVCVCCLRLSVSSGCAQLDSRHISLSQQKTHPPGRGPKKIALQFRQGKPVEFIRICKCRRQKCGIIVGKVLKMSHFNEKSLSTKSK